MTDKNDFNMMPSQQGGVIKSVINQLKLILRLMADRRVNFFVKLIPVGALIYLISPIDAISIPIVGALDDAAVLWLSSYVFTELCPPAVVAEHLEDIARGLGTPPVVEIVDAEATEIHEDPAK